MLSDEIIDDGFATPVSIRPNQRRGKNLIVILWVSLGTVAIVFISLLLMFFPLSRGFTGYDSHFDHLDLYSIIYSLSSMILGIVNIIVIVFWILWMRRAYFNLHALQLKELDYSESMAAGGWFIPLLNLWVPVQIMNQIWKRTQLLVVDNKRLVENGAIVGIWWTLFLLDRFARAGVRIIEKIDDAFANDITTLYELFHKQVIVQMVLILVLTIPLTLIAISMVKKSTRMQGFLYQKEKGEEITNTMILGK